MTEYRLVGMRGLPFNRWRPYVFHLLTRQPFDREGLEALSRLVRRGASLAPAAGRSSGWGGSGGNLGAEDVEAGDDRFLFFTACTTYGGAWPTHVRRGSRFESQPAVAFDLEDLFVRGRVGWRYIDFGAVFYLLKKHGIPLRTGVEKLTVWDREAVRKACVLECRATGGRADLRNVLRGLQGILRRHTDVGSLGGRGFQEDLDLASGLFKSFTCHGKPGYETGTASEVVLEGAIPLTTARYYLDAVIGRWRPMADLLAGATREPSRDSAPGGPRPP
jgi:hypothetical protein